MPIGNGAQYVPAYLPAVPGGDSWAPMPAVDRERIFLTPQAPLVDVYYSDAGWTGKNRCAATGSLLTRVPMPSTYTVPHTNENESAAFLMPDARTIAQVQPLARCSSGGRATSIVKFPTVDIYGPGITGAHGGSGLSAIGGSLRIGEFRPGQKGALHALKVIVYAKEVLYRCAVKSECFRWPATNPDSYSVGHYGIIGPNLNKAMRMGALLAIPPSIDIAQMKLETEPGRQFAWTLQNYGAYVVDDTWGPQFGFAAEKGPNGSFEEQFQADYGFPLAGRVRDNTPWVRDVQRLVKALHVVDNNGPNSIGGGGTPRQPLAPSIAP